MLASWNDSPAKRAIITFVQRVAGAGPGFVPAAERIATFDNDGTLWVERPMPPQFDFLLRTWAAETKNEPSLANRQPYKAIIEGDTAFFAGILTQDPNVVSPLEHAVARSWKGTTPDEFEDQVRKFIATATQPRFGVSYTDLFYRPMLELFDYLKANDFRVFVCSGGGRDFMRVFAEETWGIYKEDVIGSAADYEYVDGRIVRPGPDARRSGVGPGQAGAHRRAHRSAAAARRRERRRGYRDARIGEIRTADQPRRRAPRIRLYRRGREVPRPGRRTGLDSGEHQHRLVHRVLVLVQGSG